MSQAGYKEQLKIVSHIADAWSAARDIDKGPTSAKVQTITSSFATVLPQSVLSSLKNRTTDFSDQELSAFVVGPPSRLNEPNLYPVSLLCFGRKGDVLSLAVRVATFYELDGDVFAVGWRLEMGDSTTARQTSAWNEYAHVQQITSWRPSGDVGFDPGGVVSTKNASVMARHINESRPAFPLAVETTAGLMVAAMCSLYGALDTREMLAGVNLGDHVAEMKRILGNAP